ncbi:CHRD domain-containing protein [Streptomyces sp. ISL-11]|uniref:CHRD domain-containing protein n=1 Tax=Streptomyces sp. ISL-11 TaxID=2819174 RepID=UPI001BEC5195|nr:CHRD domain-containing protein [Streptomyces sp. ISL-11]MBT2383702.1 CHRD domain-containing protein [Streptomyces sp. ISL-11]
MNRKTIVLATTTAAVAAGVGIAFAVVPGSGGGGAAHSAHPGGGDGTGALATVSGPNRPDAVFFAGSLDGASEVPTAGGPAVGDKDGRAIAFLRVQGDEVSFAFSFRGIAAPTAAHVHLGERGKNGEVKIPFFARKVADGKTSVAGTVKVGDRKLLADLKSRPGGFYFNLHTGEFPGGAVRGQVNRLSVPLDMNTAMKSFRSSVVKGSQIYACAKREDGTFAFAQDNVNATLDGGIAHSFVTPGGAPRWIAPDRSAVTGELVARVPNGEGNIPELDLRATRSGAAGGLFAPTVEILRLNTRGGAAPSGSCDPARQPKAAVPYRADYLFIAK